jgi:hypothetical protein
MPKKKRREKDKRERAEQKRADADKVSLEVLNAYRQSTGREPLECLPLDYNPNLVSAPSLDSPFPNEGTPLKGSSQTTTLERHAENTPLERKTLEGLPQASPEEESVLDTTLDTTNEGSDSDLDWGHDTTIASAILGMSKLQDAGTLGAQALPSKRDWTFDELPQAGRAEGDGAMVLSSAGNHMIWVPSQGLAQQSQLAIHGRNLPATNDDDSNFEVDYNEESPNEDGSSTLESTALLSDENIIQNNNPAISQNNPPTTVVQAKHENKGNGKAEKLTPIQDLLWVLAQPPLLGAARS